MRSLIVVSLACVFVVSAFFIYLSVESKHKTISSERLAEPPTPKVAVNPADSLGKIKRGDHVWLVDYDANGVMKDRFRGDDYKPRSNGQIDVNKPVAEFFMPNHQMMRIIGETGEVVVPESPAQKSTDEIAPMSPSRGQIHTVTIQLFNMLPGSDANVPDETILTDNVQFDNETMLITTESYRDKSTGQLIPADEVPVRMRALPDKNGKPRGYDFDGRGLKVRWNDKDGRLELLEVAHGEWLRINDPSSSSSVLGGGDADHRAKAPPTTLPVAVIPPVSEPPQAILASEKVAAGQTIERANPAPKTGVATRPASTKTPAVPVPYVATFSDNVRITQGTEVLITADKMDVDFASKSQQQQQPATAPAAPAHVVDQPAVRPAGGSAASSEVAAAVTVPTTSPAVAVNAPAIPTTGPTTRPSGEPVLIRWTGKLVMVPLQPNRPKIAPGDSIIQLVGKPVVVRRTPTGQPEGDDIRAAHLTYHTADGSVKLVESDSLPQVVMSKLVNGQIDPRTTITTSTLDYKTDAAGKKYAVLTGPGHALMPMEPQGGKTGAATKPTEVAVMDAHWKQGANVYFIGKGQDQLAIEHIDLTGDVDVKHPQLAMQSEELSLFFEPPNATANHAAPVGNSPAPSPPYSGERVGVRGNSSNNAELTALENRPLTPTLSPEYNSTALVAGRGEGAGANPTTRPTKSQQELKRVIATKSVHAELAGQNGKKQIIDCQHLDMRTARSEEGKFYARQINADGAVHARDGEQDIKAGIVELTLKPVKPAEKKAEEAKHDGAILASAQTTTRPAKEESDTAAAELETMIARRDVFVTNKDGSIAEGDELHITTEGGESHVRLIGAPTATVIDAKKNIITGPLITAEPKQGISHVMGAGTMHMLQEQTDGSKPKPMDVTWIDQADMNGPGNLVVVTGNVAVKTYDADGTVNIATGDLVRIDLAKKIAPATRPATQPSLAAVTGPATRPAHPDSMADSMQMNGMKDKEAQRITIQGDAKVISTLSAPDGKVLRQFALFGPRIIYQLLASGPLDAKTLWVPSAGRMFVGDHRPPTTQKAPKAENDDDESNNRGDTAFQWSNQLIFREMQHNAVIVGDVVVVHQPQGKDSRESAEGPIRINSDRVTAYFEPQKRAAPAAQLTALPATEHATKPAHNADPGSSLQLKHLTADGNVIVERDGSHLFGDRIDYEPATHWMLAHGTERRPARYEPADPKEKPKSGTDMEFNTQTWNVKLTEPKAINTR